MPCEDYEDESISFGVRDHRSVFRRCVIYVRTVVRDTYRSIRWLRHTASLESAVGLLHRRRRRSD